MAGLAVSVHAGGRFTVMAYPAEAVQPVQRLYSIGAPLLPEDAGMTIRTLQSGILVYLPVEDHPSHLAALKYDRLAGRRSKE